MRSTLFLAGINLINIANPQTSLLAPYLSCKQRVLWCLYWHGMMYGQDKVKDSPA